MHVALAGCAILFGSAITGEIINDDESKIWYWYGFYHVVAVIM